VLTFEGPPIAYYVGLLQR